MTSSRGPSERLPARWYHLRGRTPLGPLDLEEIRDLVRSGEVTATTYVWSDGMPDWRRARDVPAVVPPPTVRRELAGW